MDKQTHYASYYVMNERDEWDKHTQSIVLSRLTKQKCWDFLSRAEGDLLLLLCSLIVNDEREEVLPFVVSHIDQTLMNSIGEAQRREHVPKEKRLIRQGLGIVEKRSEQKFGKRFKELEHTQREHLLTEMSQSVDGIEQAFFYKLLILSLEAYYSHPIIVV